MEERLAAIENRVAAIDAKLDIILAYIAKVNSAEYQTSAMFRSLFINLFANTATDNDSKNQNNAPRRSNPF